MRGRSLLVRADADARIGSGHVMRCLAIAQAFQDAGGSVCWLSSALPAALEARLEREGIEVLPRAAGAAALATACVAARASWVVIDGYALGPEYASAGRGAGARALIVDDDGAAGQYPADIIVDPNVFASPAGYVNRPADARLLCGPDYALLRRELTAAGVAAPKRQSAERVLCTFGGADPAGLSALAIEAFGSLSQATELRLLVGGANPRLTELQALARGRSRLAVVYDASDMRAHLEWADLAVTAAGGTCLELAFMGVPAIVAVTADNQRRVAAAFVSRGAACALGEAGMITAPAIAAAVNALANDERARAGMSRRGREMVDGQGAARVVSAMLEVS